MATGDTHDKVTIGISFILIGTYASEQWFGYTSPVGLDARAMAFGAFMGLMLSPDLDCHRSNALRRWGCLRWLWRPYRSLIPRHRHALSHLPVLGTLGRYSYLKAPFIILSVLSTSSRLTRLPLPYSLTWRSSTPSS